MRLKTIGVVGAGTAGRSIIRSLAGSALDVVFCEVSQEKVDEGLRRISASLDQEIARWSVTGTEKRLMLSRIKGTTDMRAMAGAQVIVEVTPGDLEQKQKLFEDMDKVFPADTVLVCNSATLCISDVAKRTDHPDRVVGMHFCLPVPRRPIVEIVQGHHTSARTMETARLLAKMLRKTVLEVFEMPGLVTTRIMIPYINEAIRIVMEGLATPDQVDEAIRLGFSLPIGPLAMADQIGLDILLEDMGRLYKAFGALQYHPCPLLWRMVREGRLGVKTGRGFFVYDDDGNRQHPSGSESK